MLGLAMAGLLSLPSYGQGGVHQFPKPFTPATAFAAPAWAPETPSLVPSAIDDKSKGVTIYACERMDASKKRSLIKFKSKNPANFESIRYYQYNDEVGSQMYGLTCGASDGKYYYGFFAYDYTFSQMVKHFSRIDLETGDTLHIRSFSEDEQKAWYGNGYGGTLRNALYDMAYDPSSDTFFAVGYGWNEDGSVGHSILYTIDVETGQYEKVMDFDNDIIYEFCFDAHGRMYVVRPKWMTKKDDDGNEVEYNGGTELAIYDSDFQQISAHEIKDESNSAITLAQFGSVSIDNNTGMVYWLPALETGATRIFTIDTEKLTKKNCYTAVQHSSFLPGNWFAGLYMPYLAADKQTAAGQVKNLNATPDAAGALSATLSWTNPSKAWDGSDLSALKEVRIYRKKDGVATSDRITSKELLSSSVSELIATVPADGKMGEAMQYVDSKAKNGVSTYYVVPSRVSGELGVPDSIRCCVGSDVPAAPADVAIEKSGDGLKISWSAPTDGLNNGFIVASELTYKITRLPDNKVVAENLKATSFVDNTLGDIAKYSYLIQACTKAGEGGVAKTDAVMAGSALVPPVDLLTDTQDKADLWTNYMYGGLQFYFVEWNQCLTAYGSSSDISGTLFSPALRLKGGKTYRVAADFYENEMNCSYDLKTTMGRTNENLDGATVLTDEPAIECNGYERSWIEDKFTAPEDGIYYYGLSIATHQEYNSFRLYGFKVEEIMENDMQATEIGDVREAVAERDNTCTVTVRNVGSKEQTNYKVRVLCDVDGKKVVVGETTDVPAIKPDATKKVQVKFRPTVEGIFNFYGEVVLKGDANANNNVSDPIELKVLDKDNAVWNKVVTSKKGESVDTHGPVVYWSTYDHTEHIYYAKEINGQAGDQIKRIGYVYSGNSNLTDRTAESEVKIYMGHTSMKGFASGEDAMKPSDLTLVYDGTMVLEPGTDNMLTFTLDTPFEYDPTQNLVIVVDRVGEVPKEQRFCALFNVFSANSSSGVNRSLSFSESYEHTIGKATPWESAALLYLAVENSTGITSTKVLGTQFSYDGNSGVLSFEDAVSKVAVYSVDGKLVKSADVKGGQLYLGLAKGIYVVRLTAADGKQSNVKLYVTK